MTEDFNPYQGGGSIAICVGGTYQLYNEQARASRYVQYEVLQTFRRLRIVA